jgi:hypothetical protein
MAVESMIDQLFGPLVVAGVVLAAVLVYLFLKLAAPIILKS